MKSLIYYFQFYFGKFFLYSIEKLFSLFIDNSVFFDKEDFKWIYNLEENYKLILEEYEVVNRENRTIDVTEFSKEQLKAIEPNYWAVFPFKTFGIDIHKNRLKCPETSKLIDSIPYCTTAWFSIMKPDTNVLPHRGVFKGYLRCLICIKAPENQTLSGIFINDILYNFKKGEAVVFDDTFMHSAFNKSNQERVVLYIDFIRPMPYFLKLITLLINKIISKSSYVKNFKP
jgi:ornithine lipid ester-linked acyl 2-hydroxylase